MSKTLTASVVFLMDFSSRLHQVKRLHKTPAVMCVALHGCKLLFMFTSLNTKPTIGALSSMVVLCGGFCLCVILTNILVFEYERNLDRNEVDFTKASLAKWLLASHMGVRF